MAEKESYVPSAEELFFYKTMAQDVSGLKQDEKDSVFEKLRTFTLKQLIKEANKYRKKIEKADSTMENTRAEQAKASRIHSYYKTTAMHKIYTTACSIKSEYGMAGCFERIFPYAPSMVGEKENKERAKSALGVKNTTLKTAFELSDEKWKENISVALRMLKEN
ncbi:MAG: uncharacterized protein A8A55_2531, partial [Amphiamblys sp. WSBS2006]